MLVDILPDATHYFAPLVQTLAVLTIIYASFSTLVQQDTKRLIAYSSIAHMGVVTLGLFSNTVIGIEGAILLALAHGLVSPALFICVGGVIYERTGTRLINYIRGLVTYMPVFSILFLTFTLANTGIPLTLNWLGEQLSLMGIWQQNPIVACLGATGIVLSACYSLFLYNRLSYGSLSPHLPPLKDINRREYYLLISLLIPTVVFGILPDAILTSLHISVSNLLFNIPFITPNELEVTGGLDLGHETSHSLLASSVLLTGTNWIKNKMKNLIQFIKKVTLTSYNKVIFFLNPFTTKIRNHLSDKGNKTSMLISIIYKNKYILLVFILGFILDSLNLSTKYLFIITALGANLVSVPSFQLI